MTPLSDLLDWLKELKLNRQVARQLGTGDARATDRILADCGLTSSDLCRLRGYSNEQAKLLAGMMDALGIDREAVAKSLPAVMRDLQRVCLWCDYRGKCRRDLSFGRVGPDAPPYCANGLTLELLAASHSERHRVRRSSTDARLE